MERVAIIGPGGAGKSTLARQLGAITGVPVIHLDREHWKPGWVETPAAEWEERVRELAAAERWIIDGNYGGTLDVRLDRADTVVFLDFGRFRCLRGRSPGGCGIATGHGPTWLTGVPNGSTVLS